MIIKKRTLFRRAQAVIVINKFISNKIAKYFFLIACLFLSTTLIAKENIHQLWEIKIPKEYKLTSPLKIRKSKQYSNKNKIKKGDLLHLPVSSNTTYSAKVTQVIRNKNSSTYITKIIGKNNSRAVITLGKTQIFATISTSENLFQFHITDDFTTINSMQFLYKDIALDMENDVYLSNSSGNNKSNDFAESKTNMSIGNQQIFTSNEIAQVDLMIVYTQRMADAYNGEPLTRIQHLINLTNQIFVDSGVLIHLNLVHSEVVDYKVNFSDKSINDLLSYRAPFNTTVLNNRFTKRADLLTLVDVGAFPNSNNPERVFAGIADRPGGTPNTNYNSLPVSIISADTGGDTILAHELGHNLGLGHSRRQNNTEGIGGIFPYALGYGVDNKFATIMAYKDVFNAPEILKFSSPSLDCFGVPCGIDVTIDPENSADAVKALNEMRFSAEDNLDSSFNVLPINELVSRGADSCKFLMVDGSNATFTEQTKNLSCTNNKDNTLKFLQDNPFQFVSFFSFDNNGEEIDPFLLSQTLSKNLYLFGLKNSTPKNLSALQIFSQLEVLSITNSDFTGENIQSRDLGNLNALQSIYMWNNKLTTIDFIEDIDKLFNLSASFNNITSINVLNNNYQNLKNLQLRNNQITDISPISSYLELDTLDLSYNPINDLTQFDFLSNYASIRQLLIAGLNIGDNGIVLDYISNTVVNNLDLSENNFSVVPDVSHMLTIENPLQTLMLSNNKIKNIHNIDWFVQIKSLHLRANNIYDISSLLSFDGWLLNLNYNPIFCWQKDLLIKNITEKNKNNENNIILYLDGECTIDSDNDLMPDEWESNYGLDPEDPSDAQLDYDNDGIINLDEFRNNTIPAIDSDDDGINDNNDAFPYDPNESVDTDSDGIGNNADTDDDGDGVDDNSDAFPLDASESVDTDSDGIGNNADTDDDGDGVDDNSDAFPLDASESVDTDSDGLGNNEDTDDDGDGVPDSEDAFPLDVNESLDTDGDGIGNNADTDDDGDGVPDSEDAFPLDSSRSSNSNTTNNSTSPNSSSGGGSMNILLIMLFMNLLLRLKIEVNESR